MFFSSVDTKIDLFFSQPISGRCIILLLIDGMIWLVELTDLESGYFGRQIQTSDANLTLSENGVYLATLTVDDGQGRTSSHSMEITVSNEPPVVNFQIPGGNRSFYQPNQSFQYQVEVKDKEDGTLGNGIDPSQVVVRIDYLPEGYDQIAIALGHRSADTSALVAGGKKLIEASDCKGCHRLIKSLLVLPMKILLKNTKEIREQKIV